MARTKEEINAASRERMRLWQQKKRREEIGRREPVCSCIGQGIFCFRRDSETTVGDLEEFFGRTLERWEVDLWTIAGWCGSRRFLSISPR